MESVLLGELDDDECDSKRAAAEVNKQPAGRNIPSSPGISYPVTFKLVVPRPWRALLRGGPTASQGIDENWHDEDDEEPAKGAAEAEDVANMGIVNRDRRRAGENKDPDECHRHKARVSAHTKEPKELRSNDQHENEGRPKKAAGRAPAWKRRGRWRRPQTW